MVVQQALRVLILGDKEERDTIQNCLAQIQRWQISSQWMSHFLPDEEPQFDVCIATQGSQYLHLKHYLSHCPIIAITSAHIPAESGIEVIPPAQLSPLLLETMFRLHLRDPLGVLPSRRTNAGINCAEDSRLLSQKQVFQNLFGAADAVCLVLSPDYKIVGWNLAAEKIYGYSQDAVLGRDYDLLFASPGDHPAFDQDFQLALQGHTLMHREHATITKAGEVRHINWHLTALFDATGTAEGVICCGRDCTEEYLASKNLQPSKHDFSSVFEQSALGIAIIDSEGRIHYANTTFCKQLGFDAITLRSTPFTELLDPDDVGFCVKVLENLGDGSVYHCEQRYIHRDGHPCWFDATFSGIITEKNSRQQILVILQDRSPTESANADLQSHLQLMTTLVTFSQALSRPTVNFFETLGLLGKQLTMDRVLIFRWHWDAHGQVLTYPEMLEQWSTDRVSPSDGEFIQYSLSWWRELMQTGRVIDLGDRQNYPLIEADLQTIDAVSVLGIPIFDFDNDLWGYLLCTRDCVQPRPWTELQLQTLKMAGELIHNYFVRTMAQTDLEASEALYSGIFMHSAEAIFLMRVVAGNKFLFEMVNPTYCQKMGVSVEEVIGKLPEDVFARKLERQLNSALRRCLRIKETIFYEETLNLTQGTQIWQTCLIPIKDRFGRILQVQGSGRDVTQERQAAMLQMRYARHQHLLAALTLKIRQSWQLESMLTTTVEELRKALQADRVIFWELQSSGWGKVVNEAAIANVASMLGLNIPQIAWNRGDFRLFQQGEIQICVDVKLAKFPEEHQQMLLQHQICAYAILPVLMNPLDGSHADEPHLQGLICVQQCREPKVWSVDEINLLRQLTNQISIALNQAALIMRQKHYTEELARSNKQLEQFAYISSHDLQEPLQIVSNYVQLLQRRCVDVLDERSQRYLHHILQGTQHMQTQIQDLLRYSRINTHRQPFKLVDVHQTLAVAIANLQLKINRHQAEIIFPKSLPTVMADPSQLQNVWQNLLSNALKYRGQHPPRIKIECTKNNNKWQFSVQDNGIGIASQYEERIFQIFQRLHTSEEYAGTGIGLAICQRVIETHGGTIWVRSKLGEGSTFSFTLPVDKNHPDICTTK